MAFRKRRSRFVIPARLFKAICERAPAILETLDSMETGFSYSLPPPPTDSNNEVDDEEEEAERPSEAWVYTPPPKAFYSDAK